MDELRDLRVNNKEIQSMLSAEEEEEEEGEKVADASYMFNTQIDPVLEHEVEIIMQTGEVVAESSTVDQFPSVPDGVVTKPIHAETGIVNLVN